MSDVISTGSYAEGFRAGFKAIAGTSRVLPAIPAQPATRAGFTPYLMGIRKGIEKATGASIG